MNECLLMFKTTSIKYGGGFGDISISSAPHRRGGEVFGPLFSLGKLIFSSFFLSTAPAAMQFGHSVLNDNTN